MIKQELGQLYLGTTDVDGEPGPPLFLEASDLTTHGVIVGMTGSGKTGLGVILIEEALLSRVPTLILDVKGDLTNLLLTFPELRPADFLPWVSKGDARREGKTPEELAAETAATWRAGLEGSGIEPSRIGELQGSAEFAVYTPGSSAGIPLNVVGSLAAPALAWDEEEEVLRDEIEGTVTSLLGLIDIEADPLASREHVLLSNLIERAWREGRDLDLGTLITEIQKPPFRKLGVFELDSFFPERERTELALRLNALIASPSFETWAEGAPLDPARLLGRTEATPRAAIIYLAHLSDAERQFVVTLVLSKLVTWMRGQPGSSDLQALVYMDEVFGFAPPTAVPPAKKPILTILKQARAFGVGMVLSTQNPVDLDYKAMSNAGTWMVGRLQTERDKARVLEGLQSASGDSDVAQLDATVTALDKRQFLLHSTRSAEPQTFRTRWAMSFLPGPLTRDQISMLEFNRPAPDPEVSAAQDESTEQAAADNETPTAPEVHSETSVYYLDPAAAWAQKVGANVRGEQLVAALAASQPYLR